MSEKKYTNFYYGHLHNEVPDMDDVMKQAKYHAEMHAGHYRVSVTEVDLEISINVTYTENNSLNGTKIGEQEND